MLKIIFPQIRGLQDTVLGETLAFSIQRGEFVQVLNVSGSHWITVSTIDCQQGVINVYDTIPSCHVPTRVKEQIAAIVFSPNKQLTLDFQSVQAQRGYSDCGLFAIAFATSLCFKENPVQTKYVQHLLRGHLLKCLTEGVISTFPATARKRKNTKPRGREIFEIYCVCRLPEGGKMVQCDQCLEWFHEHCVKVPEEVWKSKHAKWTCNSC